MSRSLRISIRVILILLGLMIAAVVVVKLVFTKERILALLTPRIEEAINRPVSIGDAGISFWGGIGVWLGDVTVDNREGFSEEPLLTIHKLEFKARFWPLLAGRVELDRVILHSPSLLLEYDEDHQSNLVGLLGQGERPDSTAEEPVPDEAALAAPVTVDHFVLTNGELVVNHAQPQRSIKIGGLDLDLRTEIEPPSARGRLTAFEAEVRLDSLVAHGASRGISLHEGRPRAYLAGHFNQAWDDVQLDTAEIEWLGATLLLEGRTRRHPALTEVQLNARLAPTALGDLIEEAVRAGVVESDPNIRGTISGEAEMAFVWPLPVGAVPEWRARFDLTDLTWQPEEDVAPVSAPRLELRGEENALSWTVSGGSLPGGSFSSTGTIDLLFSEEREVSTRLVANADLTALNDYVSARYGTALEGEIRTDVSAFGKLSEWRQLRLNGWCRSAGLTLVDSTWVVDTVMLAFELKPNGHDVVVEQLRWNAGHSSGHASGEISGLIPAAFSGFEPPHVPRANLNLHCPYLNLDELMEEMVIAAASDSAAVDTVLPQGVEFGLPTISATGTVTCDTVRYSAITFTSVESPLVFRDNVLTMDPITGKVYGGRAHGAYRWDVNDWEEPSFAAAVEADSVDADSVASRVLGWIGGISGQACFSGKFAGQGRDQETILPTLVGSGSVSMHSGGIEAAPLLARLGNKLGIRGMDRPHAIRDLFVRYRVENGRIFTDSLRLITSNAAWAAVGSYGFDGTLDYVADLQFTGSEGVGLGELLKESKLRFALRGTVGQPRVEIDVADAARNLIDDLLVPAMKDTAGERKDVRDLLKGLFDRKP